VEVVINQQIYGTGTGHSKQAGAKQAARMALDKIGIIYGN
jgi:dsRNA-specific ribonuclease